MDTLACATDMKRSKLNFCKQYNFVYQKFSFVYTNVLLNLIRLNAMLCFVNETKFLKAYKKDLNNISVACHRGNKRIYDGTPKVATMKVSSILNTILKHFS